MRGRGSGSSTTHIVEVRTVSYEYSSDGTEVSESIERGDWKSVPEVSDEVEPAPHDRPAGGDLKRNHLAGKYLPD